MIKPPTEATLAKYGLTAEEWIAMAESRDFKCWICGQVPKTGRLVVDHEHCKGFRKMPPEERKKRVRGLLCWWDNAQTVGRGASPQRLRRGADYLEEYARRREADEAP